MSGHKSQGAIISTKVIVEIQNVFALGLIYVMLSRTTNRQNINIIRKSEPSNFISCHFLAQHDFFHYDEYIIEIILFGFEENPTTSAIRSIRVTSNITNFLM